MRHRATNRPRPAGNYVYAWKDGEQTFYIGRGTAQRAWSMVHNPQATIRRLFPEWGFSVEILHEGLTTLDAARLERELVWELKPECNVQYIAY